jgi:hypothetical protein
VKLTQQALTPDDQRALQPVADMLDRLVAISTTNLVHDAAYRPVPGSRLHAAMSANLRDAYELAGQRLMSAEDHLRTVRVLLAPESLLPNFSLFTLIRGAAVATVHARHLLDPAIDELARLGRGLNVRLENLEQQQKVHPEVQADHFQTRIAHLERRAIANGLQPIPNKKGVTIAFGAHRYSDTELFEMYLPGIGKTYFQYVSGYAHSLPWAQLPMSRAQPSDDPEVSLVPTDVNVPVLAAVLKGALTLYDETIGYWLAHAGYPPEVWAEAKKR